MKDEYIIINKTAIQKEKEELKKLINKHVGYGEQEIYDKIDELCSQSTPLIPEIKKSYTKGFSEGIVFGMNTEYKYKTSEDYISNLKLDI